MIYIPRFLTPPGRFIALDPIVSSILVKSSERGTISAIDNEATVITDIINEIQSDLPMPLTGSWTLRSIS